MGHTVRRRARPPPAHFTPGPGHGRGQRGPRPRVLAPGDDGHRLARPDGLRAARLPRRRREDGPHLPGDRRRALLGARRPGRLAGRRHHRAARAATRSRSTPAARRSSPRRSSRPSPSTPPSPTSSSSAGRASAGARRSSPSSSCAEARRSTDDGPARRGRQARRPLQAAQGDRVPRRAGPLPRRQGRLPLGQGDGPRPARRGLSRYCASTAPPAAT